MTTHAELADVMDSHTLYFDPAGGANGSLYLALPPGENAAARQFAEALRAAGLWSEREPRVVEDSQKDAYKTQLELLAVHAGIWQKLDCLLLRCDHPTFPSDARRWGAWVDFMINNR